METSSVAKEDPILRIDTVSLRIGGLAILDRVSLELRAGEILGLIGPNGAGKTSLLNIVSGTTSPTHGSVSFKGTNLTAPTERRAAEGLGRTHQDARLFAKLSLHENVMIGALYGSERCRSKWQAGKRADAALAKVGLLSHAHLRAGAASTGQQKLASLAQVLCMRPTVMILDEPLAALSGANQALAIEIIQECAASMCGVIIVEHVMHAVLGMASTLVVLDHGEVLFTGEPKEAVKDAAVVEAYLGAGAGRAAIEIDRRESGRRHTG